MVDIKLITPTKAEQLIKEGNEICNDKDIYVVLTAETFIEQTTDPFPPYSKVVYFSVLKKTYSKAYVCKDDKLEVEYNYVDPPNSHYFYYNNILVANISRFRTSPLHRILHNALGLTGKREIYVLENTKYMKPMYAANRYPPFTAFVSPQYTVGDEDEQELKFDVYALKVQDICIINVQEPEVYNILFPLCGEKPILYLGEHTWDVMNATRGFLEKFSIHRQTLTKLIEFSRKSD